MPHIRVVLWTILSFSLLLKLCKTSPTIKKTECSTKFCIDKANEILQNLDQSVNPCESFYDFACGKFMHQELSSTEMSRSALDQASKNLISDLSNVLMQPIQPRDIKAVKDAKNFFNSCVKTNFVDITSETFLSKFLNEELGGWPILSPFVNPRKPGSRLTSIQLLNRLSEYKVQPVFYLFVTNDPKNTQNRVIKIKQPELLPPQFVLNPQYQLAFNNFVKSFVYYFSRQSNNNIDKEIQNINDLGKMLSLSAVNPMLSAKAGYKNITINQLQILIPNFPWKEYIINGVFKASGVQINQDDYILVEEWEYLSKAAEIFNRYANLNKKTLDNFMILSFIYSVAIDYMPMRYLQLKQNFMSLQTGVRTVKDRIEYCTSSTNDLLSFTTSRMYVDNYFDKNIKNKVSKITNSIINIFEETLNQLDWLDPQSRLLAKNKAMNTQTKVAYPEYLLNDSYINQHYSFDLDDKNFLKNAVKIVHVINLESYKSRSVKRDLSEWVAPPTLVNPFYDRESNQITLPAAVLHPPFYDENLPNYLNFGAIGSIIGHELTHGFDDAGRHFDKNGLFYSDSEGGLWTTKTIEKYINRTECMIQQYNEYFDKQVNLNVNGQQTLNENIADNGGLKQAYEAYQRWVKVNGEEQSLPKLNYTPNQLFFISNAQIFCTTMRQEAKILLLTTNSHSPSEFRVLGSTSNLEDFGQAFNCNKGQTNDPVKKCSIW